MAATTTTTILKLQKVECETTVQFQIDDLKACFARGAPTRYSEHFGPGLRFGLWCINDGASASHLGLYLYTSADYPALTVSWTVAGRSPGGASVHPGKTMAYTFRSGEAIGWSRFVTAEQFHASDAMRADNALVLHATLRFAPVWPIVSRPTLDAVHRVVVGRSAPDVRYVAYKRRDANGRLSGRTVLYSSREAMEQGSEELRDLCDAGSKKLSASILKNGEEAKRTAFTDYRDDDSDFEDDAPDTDQEDFDMVDAQLHADSPPNSAVTERTFVSEDEPAIKAEPISAGRVPPPNTSPPFDGRTIVILGTASRTWEALLYWLYTGTIVFAPLASAGPAARAAAVAAHTTANPDRPAPVSCKAVYRLADAVRTFLPLRLEALKRRALDHLAAQLSMQTYLHELFSPFTARYDEVRRLEMLAVVKHWDALRGSAALKEKMVDVASGRLPHASHVLADLLLRTSIRDESENAAGK
ncbi:hypothetical protein PsYK624_055660 [Phanerochaete sordida]|uniref:BTB domain-containing protein n=1 Tax=Phanerochaete sordida TaxID=48140 RepID=A0A9P3G7V5_9APHY|nr:hypothetical protein PsYK624_055660 [Phanerochaete sordida]